MACIISTVSIFLTYIVATSIRLGTIFEIARMIFSFWILPTNPLPGGRFAVSSIGQYPGRNSRT